MLKAGCACRIEDLWIRYNFCMAMCGWAILPKWLPDLVSVEILRGRKLALITSTSEAKSLRSASDDCVGLFHLTLGSSRFGKESATALKEATG
jgi:hypothetical protein